MGGLVGEVKRFKIDKGIYAICPWSAVGKD